MSLINNNLLKAAQRLIPMQSFKYLKYLGNDINEFGISVPVYDEPVDVKGNIQVVAASLYEAYGLDFSKNYRQVYSSLEVSGNEIQEQPDRFLFEDKVWEVVNNSSWYKFNGWSGTLVVEVKELSND